jgi:hypothetical protein
MVEQDGYHESVMKAGYFRNRQGSTLYKTRQLPADLDINNQAYITHPSVSSD